MSLGITHFAVGATLGLVLAEEPEHESLAMIGFGLLAMVPDLNKIWSGFDVVHDSAWATLFVGHYTLDQLDPQDSVLVGVVALAVLCCVAVAERLK